MDHEILLFGEDNNIDKKHKTAIESGRFLGSNDADFSSVFVDKNGEEYEPYSLAWRYLGMYIDCDSENDNNSGDGGDGCQRVILWAAYVDPRYKGGQIGEYQFYDIETDTWDDSTCTTGRCAKMDCHEANSHFNLIGVYKETDGFYDWAEQLFKHEGYCVWDDDEYSFMQTYREQFPSSCTSLWYADASGNSVYYGIQAQGEGNMTFGLYTDESCSELSEEYNMTEYLRYYYGDYYGDEDVGDSKAEAFDEIMEEWNDYMKTWKICQPCRSYSLEETEYGNDNDRRRRTQLQRRRRHLGDDNDGEGEEEENGYNCYDDAGYWNCNQCYKFETKTSIEEASMNDLATASAQGTMLQIKVNGRVFGSGGFGSTSTGPSIGVVITFAVAIVGALLFLLYRKYVSRDEREALPPSFKEQLYGYGQGEKEAGEKDNASHGPTVSSQKSRHSNQSGSGVASIGQEIIFTPITYTPAPEGEPASKAMRIPSGLSAIRTASSASASTGTNSTGQSEASNNSINRSKEAHNKLTAFYQKVRKNR